MQQTDVNKQKKEKNLKKRIKLLGIQLLSLNHTSGMYIYRDSN